MLNEMYCEKNFSKVECLYLGLNMIISQYFIIVQYGIFSKQLNPTSALQTKQ